MRHVAYSQTSYFKYKCEHLCDSKAKGYRFQCVGRWPGCKMRIKRAEREGKYIHPVNGSKENIRKHFMFV